MIPSDTAEFAAVDPARERAPVVQDAPPTAPTVANPPKINFRLSLFITAP